jgi:hypothetical protein
MILTGHARKRKQQRGFSSLSIEIIRNFGRIENAPGGVAKVFLGRKECQQACREFKRAIQLLDKSKGGTLIIDGDYLITLYK